MREGVIWGRVTQGLLDALNRPSFARALLKDSTWLPPWTQFPCKLWKGRINRNGYGYLQVGTSRQKVMAHVLMYHAEGGPVPRKNVLAHLCRNRACIEVRHLEPVSVAENTRRGYAARKR